MGQIMFLQMLIFLQFLFFAKSSVNFIINVWHNDRTLSKILHGAIPIPVHDLTVKVTDFEFLLRMLNVSNVSFYKAFDGYDSCLA